jgi:hypothetical protein
MHIAMRKYRQLKGTPEDTVNWVKNTLVPILKRAGGRAQGVLHGRL